MPIPGYLASFSLFEGCLFSSVVVAKHLGCWVRIPHAGEAGQKSALPSSKSGGCPLGEYVTLRKCARSLSLFQKSHLLSQACHHFQHNRVGETLGVVPLISANL